MSGYFVYLLASVGKALYVGVTNDLQRRVWQHRAPGGSLFTSAYRIGRLVYFEETTDVQAAIAREKQIKGWRRSRKVGLIESANPQWRDLAADWFEAPASAMSFRGAKRRGISTVGSVPDGRDSSLRSE